MKRIFFLVLTVCCLELFADQMPRHIIAFYDSIIDDDLYFSRAHQLAEMPCNHLGLVFDYYDVHQKLPDLQGRDDVLGVLIWFGDDTKIGYEEGVALYDWTLDALERGKKVLVMGNPVFQPDVIGLSTSMLNRLWEKLGMAITGSWEDQTYNMALKRLDPAMTDFEREYPLALPDFVQVTKISDKVTCFLEARSKTGSGPAFCLAAVSPSGGYVADRYEAYYLYERGKVTRKWYLNPFLFFKAAFQVDSMPKPDTTTLAGRRIYYSHVDGDGWNNQTEIGDFRLGTIAAEVLLERIYKKYPDYPVTVGPIGADVDPEWAALRDSRTITEKIFSLDHVEVASHTFTHPFDWGFFEDYRPADEVPYLHLYPNGSWLGTGIMAKIRSYFDDGYYYAKEDDTIEDEEVLGELRDVKTFDEVYDVPRAFALKPFDLELEISGSVDLINTLGNGKKVALYQWSGDCRPFYEAVKGVEKLGIMNINGGDSRFDNVYSSYAWVAPVGRQVKDLRQVYASNANENLYTNLWRNNFFGFNLLPQTFQNTESPIRIKPMNFYYHIYSGQKNASLKALEQNMEYVQAHETIPIKASEFASIGQGFYSTKIDRQSNDSWSFCCRQGLQTIRFDDATLKSVDLSRSKGVVGFRHYQGSLYVYLDSAFVDDALIALKPHSEFHKVPVDSRYYLIESRWQVFDVKSQGSQSVLFRAQGFGLGEMRWNVPSSGWYKVESDGGEVLVVEAENRMLDFTFHARALQPITMTISKLPDHNRS